MEIKNITETLYDLCIVGSGPAGMIVAMEYSKLNPERKVLLIEYGVKDQMFEKNNLDETIINTNPVNHHNPYECTNKGLGGSSATWGGRCVMFDEIDFMQRPVLKGQCTWDLDLFNEVKHFLSNTTEYFECGEPMFDLSNSIDFKVTSISEKFKKGIVTDSVLERYSMPTRFGKRFLNDIKALKNLEVIEGYEARDFEAPNDNGSVNSLKIRCVSSLENFTIKAKSFVLAAGTQETTRILLRNKQLFNLLKKVPQALGKYYQGHLSGKIASVHFIGDPKKTDYGFLKDKDGVYTRRRFQFTKDLLLEKKLLNTAIWLDNPLYFDPKHRSGPMSVMYLMMLLPVIGRKLAPPAIAHSITKGKVTGIKKHIWNVIKDLPGSLIIPGSIFIKRYLMKRKLPGVFLYSPKNHYALHFHTEQIPFEENRMELDTDGETLKIYYKLTDVDIDSIIKTHEILDDWLKETGAGKLEYWYEQKELQEKIKEMSCDGIHQSGTTRIANSSEEGVVDRDLKLWGTENVFICSSSVFPTSSQANPTFFLGAFAVRLANHLTKKYEKN
ncbi:GMC oxidoreductase [Flavobacterium ajazii]|uniref:GMC oxidoreductase n=1 Tax=Flavobacterium ajazii TaxID=2692318 RepID=UPI0013D1AB47|nr:GMC oxidoreductase [Flavobacterium ajazii]